MEVEGRPMGKTLREWPARSHITPLAITLPTRVQGSVRPMKCPDMQNNTHLTAFKDTLHTS